MKSFKQGASRWGRRVLAALSLTVLGACGGGGSPIQAFAPTRIIAFGDEMSAITTQGQKYGINGINSATNLVDCTLDPNWVQSLAASFLLSFPQCDAIHSVVPLGIMYATNGAKVADAVQQVNQHFSLNYFTSKDLVTMLVGMNDIIELYNAFPGQSQTALIAQAKTRGTQLGDLVNRIAQAGGKVIVSTIPDMGTTPFALTERLNKVDIDRAAFLSSLSDAFNTAMRVELINDGSLIGLVLLDQTTQSMARYPSIYGMTNATDQACLVTVTPINCTTNTLANGATPTTYMWATNLLLSPGAQTQLANQAISRAKNNPF